jgi:hypothetical protein
MQADIHTARITGKPLQEVHRFLLTDALGQPIDDPVLRDKVVKMVRPCLPGHLPCFSLRAHPAAAQRASRGFSAAGAEWFVGVTSQRAVFWLGAHVAVVCVPAAHVRTHHVRSLAHMCMLTHLVVRCGCRR